MKPTPRIFIKNPPAHSIKCPRCNGSGFIVPTALFILRKQRNLT